MTLVVCNPCEFCGRPSFGKVCDMHLVKDFRELFGETTVKHIAAYQLRCDVDYHLFGRQPTLVPYSIMFADQALTIGSESPIVCEPWWNDSPVMQTRDESEKLVGIPKFWAATAEISKYARVNEALTSRQEFLANLQNIIDCLRGIQYGDVVDITRGEPMRGLVSEPETFEGPIYEDSRRGMWYPSEIKTDDDENASNGNVDLETIRANRAVFDQFKKWKPFVNPINGKQGVSNELNSGMIMDIGKTLPF